MAIEYLDQAWRNSTANGEALLLMLALADVAGEGAIVRPDAPSLCRKARINPKKLDEILSELILLGEIKLIKKPVLAIQLILQD